MVARLSKEDFINKSILVHGDKYTYDKVVYIHSKKKVVITCREHGSFEQIPSNHVRGRGGCRKCNSRALADTNKFITKAQIKHNYLYTYDNCIYKHSNNKVLITCKKHGDFLQRAYSHLLGNGCPRCKGEKSGLLRAWNTEKFILEANVVHMSRYDYSKSKYINTRKLITIICQKHGDFKQTPNSHLAGHGCSSCTEHTFSKKSIRWIEEKAKSLRMKNVQHALNGGEFKIPGVGKVDGYHARTKTVFEFHGDAFHGNPERFGFKTKCHPYDKNKTAIDLYRTTLKRDNLIKRLGYRLFKIWEYDYNKGEL